MQSCGCWLYTFLFSNFRGFTPPRPRSFFQHYQLPAQDIWHVKTFNHATTRVLAVMTCCCGHGPFHSHVTQNPRFKSCQFLSAPKVFFTCLQTMPGFRLAAWHSWRMTPETICFSPSAVVNNFLDRAIRLATCSVVLYLVFTGVSIFFIDPPYIIIWGMVLVSQIIFTK